MKAIVVTDQAAETAGMTPQKAPVWIPGLIRGYGTFSQVRRYVPTVPPAGFEPATPALGETSSSLSWALTSGFFGSPT